MSGRSATGVDAGDLRHLVALLAPAAGTPNAYGEQTGGFAVQAQRRASIGPLSGRELYAARMVQADVTHRIVFRYVAGVLPSWIVQRLDAAGDVLQTFKLYSVRDIEERHINLECMAKEVV